METTIAVKVEGHKGAVFTTGRRVADNVLKAVVRQLLEHALDAVDGQRVFVAGLGGGQNVQLVTALVFDQGLFESRFAVDDVDEVVHHAALAVHDQVQVAQTNIKINHSRLVATHGQTAADGGAAGGFAHTAFTGRYNDDFSHKVSLFVWWLLRTELFGPCCQRFKIQCFVGQKGLHRLLPVGLS